MKALDARLYDIAVIGGGISGLGVAEQAVRQGLSAVLFEQGRVGAATSANSLRIMHGGIRYLQNLDVRRVVQSASAQQDLLSDFPDLLSPLRCVMPLQPRGLKSAMPMRLGALLYSGLARARIQWARAPRVVPCEQLEEWCAALCPWGAFEWHDLQLRSPAALHSKLAEALREPQARLMSGCRVDAVRKKEKNFLIQSAQGDVASRVVVDTRGPWVARPRFEAEPEFRGGWCKAFNLVLSKQILPDTALGIETEEKRLFFLVPREGHSALGTAYLPFDGSPESAVVTEPEIETFIGRWNAAAPSLAVNRGDVRSIEVGILPIEGDNAPEPKLIGQERISDHDGYLQVISTKYTTFRPQAQRVIKIARRYLSSSRA